jgi:hypothetical protein
MIHKGLSSLCFVVLMLSLVGAAPRKNGNQKPTQVSSWNFLAGAGPFEPITFGTPSSPDNWLGGTGNWSNGGDWSAGLPGVNGEKHPIQTSPFFGAIRRSTPSLPPAPLGGK